MGTTDSNGIYFYEDTDAVSPLHTLLNLGQTSVSNALDSLGVIRPAANQAAQDALVTAHSPSPTNPLFVWRSDLDIVYRHNGTNSTKIAWGTNTEPTAFTAYGGTLVDGGFNANFTNLSATSSQYSQPVTYQRLNNECVLGGIIAVGANFTAGAIMARLPAGYRPSATPDANGRRRFIQPYGGNVLGMIEISGNGNIIAQTGTGAGDAISLDGIRFQIKG